MEKLVSSWFAVGSLPENYVFPPGKRPGNVVVPLDKSIPVIDLQGHDHTKTIQEILKAGQEFGFFQVINHGVPKDLMDDTMSVAKEFHMMPAEEKTIKSSRDPTRSCKLYTSSEKYGSEEVHFWRDALIHPCNPLEECIQFWPEKPSRYREVIASYTTQVCKLGSRILELMGQGLGLDQGHFSGDIIANPTLLINHYPPCPEPSLTLGLKRHTDPSLITILLQDVYGLQVLKEDKWVGVEPLPHAFVVNIGYVLQIISNGKLKGAEHRVVTNSSVSRTTVSLFIYPSDEHQIEPAKTLVSACNPQLYRALTFKDFRANFLSMAGDIEAVEEFIRSKLHRS